MDTRARRVTLAVIMTLSMLVLLLVSLVDRAPEAKASYACPRFIAVWPMNSRWPVANATIMGSDWIDLAHRPSGGVRVEGRFVIHESVQYHWCMDTDRPKFTGHISAYRAKFCVMFTGFRPTGVRSVHWNDQGSYWPSRTSGKRQWYRTAEKVLRINTSAEYKNHWQCQLAAVSSPWISISKNPQHRTWGYTDKANAKDWHFTMHDGSHSAIAFYPADDQHGILF